MYVFWISLIVCFGFLLFFINFFSFSHFLYSYLSLFIYKLVSNSSKFNNVR